MNYVETEVKSAKRFNIHTTWGLGAAWRPCQFEIMNYEGLPRKKREAL